MVAELECAAKVFNVAHELGLLTKLKNKLIGSPDAAQAKLAEALDLVQRFHSAVNEELVAYLSLAYATNEEDIGKTLLHATSREARARLEAARTHCSQIGPIFHEFLSPVFISEGRHDLYETFLYKLVDSDQWVVNAIAGVAAWLERHATGAKKLFDSDQWQLARKGIREAATEIQDVQAALCDGLLVMRQVQRQLIETHSH